MAWVLTTRCSAGWAAGGEALIGGLVDLGAAGIEVASGLDRDTFAGAARAIRAARVPLVSLCAPCPVPRLAEGERLPEALDPDPGIRAASLRLARATVEQAHEREAAFVVAALSSPSRRERDAALARDLPRARAMGDADAERLREAVRWRAARTGPDTDAAKRLLERLIDDAAAYGLRIAIANRTGLHGYPSPDELRELLREFRGAPLGIWFDLGAAGILAELDGEDPRLAETDVASILGVRLHDVDGWQRHLPPGRGELDRQLEARVVRAFRDRPCVLDIARGTSREEILRARARLEEIAGT